MPPANKSIFDFFKKAPPPTKKPPLPAEPPRQTNSGGTKAVPLPSTRHTSNGKSKPAMSKTPEPPENTSSLSPPPPTPSESGSSSGGREQTPVPVISSNASFNRVISSTDDEESDSSLEELEVILACKRTETQPTRSLTAVPKTPNASRFVKANDKFPASPLAVLSKSQFDMKSLMSHAQKDDAVEASSKRLKAMMAPKNEKEHSYLELQDEDAIKTRRDALLESVASEQEGGMAKVSRALMRTEATIPEKRWYFFDTSSKPGKATANPFPKGQFLRKWEGELRDPQMRQQCFMSGFVEDMVSLGKQLPDELFLWILDEAFLESRDPLRNSYLNVLRECPEQIERLISLEVVQSLFRKLGATDSANIITQNVKAVMMISNPYPNHDWTRICSTINFLGKIGASLKSNSRVHLICMILRMCVDRAVIENVDLLVEVHRAIYYLCRDTPDDEWQPNCSNICKALMTTVPLATFRLQIVDSIPSGSARTHDLRRRLAMCFFFKDTSYAASHPHSTMDLDNFIKRLDDSDFDARPKTEYLELTAMILLLDVAVDDGQSIKLDLTDPEVEKKFNEDVDDLVASIKAIMTSIGNPGAAFISRIAAKEALELVSQRIADTVRTKKVVKQSWFDIGRGKVEDKMVSEKEKMRIFLGKTESIKKEAGGIVAT